MKKGQRTALISNHFPYIPVEVSFRNRLETVEALLDTGFDGDVIVPEGFIGNGDPPDDHLPWRMVDGSIINAQAYWGKLQIDGKAASEVLITVLGKQFIIGRNAIQNLKVTLDKGKRVIID